MTTHPVQVAVVEVAHRRMGVVSQMEVPEDELVVEYKVSRMHIICSVVPPIFYCIVCTDTVVLPLTFLRGREGGRELSGAAPL